MSCNGCRVLRRGCNESCVLRHCLLWIKDPQAQGHATIFLAKYFGRSALMSLISAVPEAGRPALFESLLYEACGRTLNPVDGAIGLVWTGSWNVCQMAVETVLRGDTIQPRLIPAMNFNKAVAAGSNVSDLRLYLAPNSLKLSGNRVGRSQLASSDDSEESMTIMSYGESEDIDDVKEQKLLNLLV